MDQLETGLTIAAGIGALFLVAWEVYRRFQNLDATHGPGLQEVDRLRKEVEILKAEQRRQRWYDLLLAIVVAAVALGYIFSPH